MHASTRSTQTFKLTRETCSLALSLFTCVLLSEACYAQCAGSNAVTPLTATDESSTVPNSRQLVNGENTTIDTTTPNQIKVNATIPSATSLNYFGNGSDGNAVISSATTVGDSTNDSGFVVMNYKSLHIQSGGSLTTQARKFALLVYVQEDCSIDSGGILHMNSKGAAAAASIINIKKLTDTYDSGDTFASENGAQVINAYVSTTFTSAVAGGAGGTASTAVGHNGGTVANGTGGGGGGGGRASFSGAAGRPGTAYCGGSGSGGSGGASQTGGTAGVAGATNGGAGGNGGTGANGGTTSKGGGGGGGGGAGNPGGSGGTGGVAGTGSNGSNGSNGQTGGSGGGGTLILVVGRNLTVNGTISANGGAGGNGGDGGSSGTGGTGRTGGNGGNGGGGGGGGRMIVLYGGTYTNSTGTISASGGAGGEGGSGGSGNDGNGANGNAGGAGGNGTVTGPLKISGY